MSIWTYNECMAWNNLWQIDMLLKSIYQKLDTGKVHI